MSKGKFGQRTTKPHVTYGNASVAPQRGRHSDCLHAYAPSRRATLRGDSMRVIGRQTSRSSLRAITNFALQYVLRRRRSHVNSRNGSRAKMCLLVHSRRLLAYALRASMRSTPFGLFAAISRVAIGERTTLEVESEMHTRTRVDMGWLAELITQWREEPEFRKKLRVTVNDAMLRRGDRYTAYHPLRTGRGQKGLTYTPMTFTRTDAVHFLEGKAQYPLSMHAAFQALARAVQ